MVGFWHALASSGPYMQITAFFLVFYAKDLREIRPGSPPTRAPNAGWVVKIGDFRQITGGLYLENDTI